MTPQGPSFGYQPPCFSLTPAPAPSRFPRAHPRLPRSVSHAPWSLRFPLTARTDACLRPPTSCHVDRASQALDRTGCSPWRHPPAAPPRRQPPAAAAASGVCRARGSVRFASLPHELRLLLHGLDLAGPAAGAHPGAAGAAGSACVDARTCGRAAHVFGCTGRPLLR